MWPAWRARPGVDCPEAKKKIKLAPRGTSKKGRVLLWCRRISQAAFLFLFMFLLVRTEYRGNFADRAQETSRMTAVVGAAIEVSRVFNLAGASLAGAPLPAAFVALGDGQYKLDYLDALLPEIRLDLPTSIFLEADPLVAVSTMIATRSLYGSLAWALVLLGLTIFLGRFFCGWICPLGTLNHIFSYIRPSRVGARRIQANLTKPYQWLKYYILIAMLVMALFTTLQVGLLDPICFLTRSMSMAVLPAANYAVRGTLDALDATDVAWLKEAANVGYAMFDGNVLAARQGFFHWGWVIGAIFIGIMLLNRYITRFWCRALCPLGAFLGIFSRFSIFGLRKDHAKCTDCNLCLVNCQAADSPQGGVKWQGSECHLCFNCEAVCPDDVLHFEFFPNLKRSVAPAPDLGKRAALFSGFVGLATYPMSRASDMVSQNYDHRVIRPPGSVEEKEFLERCIKCCECMKVCPNNALHPALFEAGLEGVWSPIMISRIGYCEHECVLCGSVCPTGAIRNISVLEKVGRGEYAGKPIKMGTAFYDLGRCLPWSMDTPCIVCEEICPTSPKAIWAIEEWITKGGVPYRLQKPKVDPQLCIGCGACEKVCPVKDKPAVYVTAIGESRSDDRQLLLDKNAASNDRRWEGPQLVAPGKSKLPEGAQPANAPNLSAPPPAPNARLPNVAADPKFGQAPRPDRAQIQAANASERSAAASEAKGARIDATDKQASLLPTAVGGFVPREPPRAFAGKNLWEYMNGSAPGFTKYGFRRMVVCEYTRPGNDKQSITVEIFDMGSPRGAFGRFAEERDPTYAPVALGVDGFSSGGLVALWAQRFFVKATGTEDNAEMNTLLLSFARAVAAKIGVAGKPLPVFARFPHEGRKPRTDRYWPRELGDVPGMSGGFSIDFKTGGRDLTLMIADTSSESGARKALARVANAYPRAKVETDGADEVLSVGGEEDAILFVRRKGELAGVKGRLPHADALAWVRRLFLRKGGAESPAKKRAPARVKVRRDDDGDDASPSGGGDASPYGG
jgi:polyferredoxin